MRQRAAVQTAHLRIESIADGMLRLPGGRDRAVLEVEGVPFGLQSDDEQEAVLAGYTAFLNSLTFPVQVLVRTVPADLTPYLERVEGSALQAAVPQLAALARDHAAFVRRLARQRTLLERRCYLVVPADDPSVRLGLLWPFRRRRHAAREAEVARVQLALRCEEVSRELGRCGLTVHRLRETDLAGLLYACWCPDLSRIQRLRRDLAEYAALAVQADRARSRTSS